MMYSVGGRVEMNVLEKFVTLVKETHVSVNARRLFKDTVGQSLKYPNSTRWWSTYEMITQLATEFPRVVTWIQGMHAAGYCERTTKKLQKLLKPDKQLLLKLQLATIMDAFDEFIKATYFVSQLCVVSQQSC